jgi:lysophospholipase L1-like esterase
MVLLLLALLADEPKKSPFDKWEKAIAAMEKRDKEKPPADGAVFFCGSSSIVKWNLEKSFPGRKVVKRGFGGSKIADTTHFASRILFPYKPSAIVFYAGDNDIGGGAKPEKVLADFNAFVLAVRKKMPAVPIYFIAIKPSIKRWALWEKMKKANELVREECNNLKLVNYIDIATPMLDKGGKPPAKELFVKDGLHLSEAGYKMWSKIVEGRLKADGVK